MKLTVQQAELAAENHKLIYSFLRTRGLNADDWYDVCAIAYCRSVASYDDSHGTRLSTYVYGAMDFAVMSLQRSLRRKEANTAWFSLDNPIGSDEMESLTYLDMFGEEDKSLLSLENRELVDYCLSRLNPLQKKAVGLHSMGVTTNRIGEMMGFSQSYISRILTAARGKINNIRDKQFCLIPHQNKEEKQMAKSKFTDDEIYALIDEGKTNAQIARAMGMTQGSVNTRINRLRSQGEKAKEETKPPEPKLEKQASPTGNSFPFAYGEQIMYDGRLHIVNSVGQDRMIIRENATLAPRTITADDFERNKALFKKLKPKSENQYENITRNRPDEEPDVQRSPGSTFKPIHEIVKAAGQDRKEEKSVETLFRSEPAPEQKTKFEQVAERLKENEKASIGMSDAIADAYGLPANKPAPCVHFTQDCKDPDTDSCEECKDFKDEIKLDLEMESSADPVSPFARNPAGYIDPEWFNTLPRQGTVEYRIWHKAIQGIKDLNAARDEIKKALEVGDRLPAPYVERYNRIASKYSEEAGA